MVKNLLIFIFKLVLYATFGSLWFGIAFPFLISYPSDILVIGGFLLTVLLGLVFIYFLYKTIKNFFIKNKIF